MEKIELQNDLYDEDGQMVDINFYKEVKDGKTTRTIISIPKANAMDMPFCSPIQTVIIDANNKIFVSDGEYGESEIKPLSAFVAPDLTDRQMRTMPASYDELVKANVKTLMSELSALSDVLEDTNYDDSADIRKAINGSISPKLVDSVMTRNSQRILLVSHLLPKTDSNTLNAAQMYDAEKLLNSVDNKALSAAPKYVTDIYSNAAYKTLNCTDAAAELKTNIIPIRVFGVDTRALDSHQFINGTYTMSVIPVDPAFEKPAETYAHARKVAKSVADAENINDAEIKRQDSIVGTIMDNTNQYNIEADLMVLTESKLCGDEFLLPNNSEARFAKIDKPAWEQAYAKAKVAAVHNCLNKDGKLSLQDVDYQIDDVLAKEFVTFTIERAGIKADYRGFESDKFQDVYVGDYAEKIVNGEAELSCSADDVDYYAKLFEAYDVKDEIRKIADWHDVSVDDARAAIETGEICI